MLKLSSPHGEVVRAAAPGPGTQDELPRARHLGIGAHPDDLELMSWSAIAAGSYVGVVVADGADSPRGGPFAGFTREQMASARRGEQREAARRGGYDAVAMLGHASAAIKGGLYAPLIEDLVAILDAVQPEAVYTHSLCDTHDTHVAVASHVIASIRQLPPHVRPRKLYGCEVWGSLDWLQGPERVLFDVSALEGLGVGLVQGFASQIESGKRYDLAAAGRRRANATFSDPHAADAHAASELATDMSALIENDDTDPHAWTAALLERHRDQVSRRLRRFW